MYSCGKMTIKLGLAKFSEDQEYFFSIFNGLVMVFGWNGVDYVQ